MSRRTVQTAKPLLKQVYGAALRGLSAPILLALTGYEDGKYRYMPASMYGYMPASFLHSSRSYVVSRASGGVGPSFAAIPAIIFW